MTVKQEATGSSMQIKHPSGRKAAVKQEPSSFTQQVKQEEVGSSMQSRRPSSTKLAAVKQESNNLTQPAINATCTCGGSAMRCSALECHQLYCRPCDKMLKAAEPTKGFRTCSFFCCMRRKGFTKVRFCAILVCCSSAQCARRVL